MARPIPEGYELVSGRGTASARKAIELAEDRGLDSSTVLTQGDGYLVPLGADSHIHSAEAPAGPVGNPIANIAERQTTEAIVEEIVFPKATDSHDEIDAFATEHNVSFEELGDKPTRAEKVAHLETVINDRAEANDKNLAETGELRSSTETKED